MKAVRLISLIARVALIVTLLLGGLFWIAQLLSWIGLLAFFAQISFTSIHEGFGSIGVHGTNYTRITTSWASKHRSVILVVNICYLRLRKDTALVTTNQTVISHQLNHLNWRIFLLALGMFVLGTDAFVVAGVLPVIAHQMRVSEGLSGQLVTIFSLTYGLGVPLLAALTGKLPRNQVLLVALAAFCLASQQGQPSVVSYCNSPRSTRLAG